MVSASMLRVFQRVLAAVSQWQNNTNPRPIHDITPDSVRSLNLSRELDFNHLSPNLTKDVYYSAYVHMCLELGVALDGCVFSILEAILCMSFTPSPSGWCNGVERAMADNSEENFFVRFVNANVGAYGCVSGGGHNRRQVSHGRDALIGDLFQSLSNLLVLIDEANNSDDTPSLVAAFKQPPRDGGVAMAGPLIAQEMINVLTKVGLITNQHHASNVIMASGTKTSKRLNTMGIKTDESKADLFTYLAAELDLPIDAAENATCEGLRHASPNTRQFWESVGGSHNIYFLDNGVLKAYDFDGGAVALTRPEWRRDGGAFRGIRWWAPGYETTHESEMGRRLVLTTKKRKRG